MTPGPGFDLAAALPFAVPGPTNTLVAIGGARRHERAMPALAGAAPVGFVAAVAALIGLARTRTRRPQRTPRIPYAACARGFVPRGLSAVSNQQNRILQTRPKNPPIRGSQILHG